MQHSGVPIVNSAADVPLRSITYCSVTAHTGSTTASCGSQVAITSCYSCTSGSIQCFKTFRSCFIATDCTQDHSSNFDKFAASRHCRGLHPAILLLQFIMVAVPMCAPGIATYAGGTQPKPPISRTLDTHTYRTIEIHQNKVALSLNPTATPVAHFRGGTRLQHKPRQKLCVCGVGGG